MTFKAVAKSRKTGNHEWFGITGQSYVFTDGEEVYLETPKNGFRPLKDPVEVWMLLKHQHEWTQIFDKEKGWLR